MPRLSEMTYKEAEDILGLSSLNSYTVDSLNKIYRDKIKEAHPDAGGSPQEAVKLNVAKRTLMQKINETPSVYIVPESKQREDVPYNTMWEDIFTQTEQADIYSTEREEPDFHDKTPEVDNKTDNSTNTNTKATDTTSTKEKTKPYSKWIYTGGVIGGIIRFLIFMCILGAAEYLLLFVGIGMRVEPKTGTMTSVDNIGFKEFGMLILFFIAFPLMIKMSKWIRDFIYWLCHIIFRR